MIDTNCNACRHYNSPSDVPCSFRHRHPDRTSATYGCDGYVPWLQVAQQVLHRHIRTLHGQLDAPGNGYRSLLGGLNRKGREALAHAEELEALLEQSEAIPYTTPKPPQLMQTVTPSVPEYTAVLQEILAGRGTLSQPLADAGAAAARR